MLHSRPALLAGPLAVMLLAAGSESSGQIVRQLTDHKAGGELSRGEMDAAGSAVYFVTATDPADEDAEGRFQIMRWDATTGAVTQITSFEEGIRPVIPVWGLNVDVSDDGQWLAFVSTSDPLGTNHDMTPEAFAMRSDGTSLAQLSDNPDIDAASVIDVAISGDGGKVLFVSLLDSLAPPMFYQLFIVDRDGTDLRLLAETTLPNAPIQSISISDDGQRVAFICPEDLIGGGPAAYRLYVMNADGTGLRELPVTAAPYSAHISGNGDKIAYGDYGIRVINWDGTGLTLLTGNRLRLMAPAWCSSPKPTCSAAIRTMAERSTSSTRTGRGSTS